MAQPALRDIYHAFARQAEKARTAFAVDPAAPDCDEPHQNNREWCVVYLFDAWARCCRALVIGSAYASPIGASGAVVTPVAASESAALVTIRKGFGRGGIWEPQWGSPGDAVQAAVLLTISNLGQVSAALGATPNPAEDIRVVRNFIAHRNPRTGSELRALGARLKAPVSQRADGLLTMQSPPSQTLFDRWVSELKIVVAAAVF
jgi:hypothetical protein